MLAETMVIAGPLATLVAFTIGWRVTDGPKCILCKKRSGKVIMDVDMAHPRWGTKDHIKSVWHTQYHKKVWKDKRVYTYFHSTCVEKALCNPNDIDKAQLAVRIIDKYKNNRKYELEDIKRKELAKKREFQGELRRRLTLKSICKKARNDGLFLD